MQHIADLGFDRFYTATTRFPRRHEEMQGGSVYFVRGKVTLFRMPFITATDDRETALRYQGEVLIEMKPELIRVAPKRIGFLRGWRYMKDEDAPPDLPRQLSTDYDHGDEMPPEMRRDLKEAGLL